MSFRVHVRVMPRDGLLDPQGQAVEHALAALGFAEAGGGPRRPGHRARRGGRLPARGRGPGRARCATSCWPTRSPRTTCSRWRRPDARGGGGPVSRQQLRLRHAARRRARRAPTPTSSGTATPSLQGADVVILPGGFSYGDYLRSGAIARFSPVMQAVQRHAADGGPVLGICNGFQILCEAHLLPGALHAERRPHLRLEAGGRRSSSGPTPRSPRPTRRATGSGCRSRTATAGSWRADDTLRMLEAEGRVVLRYVAATEALAAPAQSERLRQPHRRHLQRRRAPWSASCRTPSASPTALLGVTDGTRILHLPRGLAAAATPRSRCPADEDRQAQPQRGRVLRQAGCRAAPASSGRRPRPPRARPSARRTT